MLAGPAYYLGCKHRRDGFRNALRNRGATVNPKHEILCEPDENGGFEAAQLLLKKHPNLDGLFCFNDLVAVGALAALKQLAMRVPDDVAVVGFDDIRLASLIRPTLSTVRVDKGRLGRAMVQMLLSRIQNHRPGDAEEVIRPELVIRESAPLPSGQIR